MKTIILIILSAILALPQSKLLLLLNDDNEQAQKLTIIANTSNYVIDDGGDFHYFLIAGIPGEKFIVDWGDGSFSKVTLTGSSQRLIKTYANPGTYNVKMYGWENITKIFWRYWNAGNFDLKDLPPKLTYLYLNYLDSTIIGNINNLPSGLTYLYLSNIGSNITGSIDSLPSGLTFLLLNNFGNNITGSIDNLPSGLTTLYIYYCGTNLTGSIGSLNSNITNITFFYSGNNFDLTTNLKPFNNADINIYPQPGYGYTTAQIDSFLIAYDAVAGIGNKTIDLRGANQPRSSASDAAVISLTAKGRTILTNP